MNSPTQPSSPTATMLKGQIEAGKARLLAGGGDGHDGFLLFSSPQEAMPKLAFLDPILDPVEKTVFANIWIHAKEQGIQMAGFPSHRILMSRCNIRRRQAIARSMTILRLLRWITLCETVQEPGTRVFRGNIYALHDEPATLALVQELDAGYLGYLEQCRHSPDPRVRDIAARVTAGIDAEIASGHDPTKHDPVRAQNARLEALEAIRMLEQDPQAGESPVAFFGVPVAPVSPKSGEENYQVQNPNMVIARKSPEKPEKSPGSESEHGDFERSSSSRYIYKKTTTTPPVDKSGPENGSTLIKPPEISDKEFDLALHRMRNFPLEQQQDMLDELGEQIRVRKDTPNPIWNPVGYLSWLCQQLERGGQPLTSACLARQKRRAREAKREKAERLANERAMKKLEQMLKERGVG